MKRKGSIAIYMEPWHADIMEFLDLRKNQGKEEIRARDLFLAMWMNDLFMERVDLDKDWSLMCPNECKGLGDTYGDEFRELYLKYESEGKYKKVVKAREVWNKILESQIETGTPYILYKDTINERSNQKNIGVIKSSNLCLDGSSLVSCKINSVEEELDMVTIDGLFKDGKVIEVLSRDVKNGLDEWCLVENSGMINNNAETIKVTDKETGNFIICTEDHKIWTENRGYIKAIDLNVDDIVKINLNKRHSRSIIKIERVKNRPVYDITVNKNNNFYANNILVHNCGEIVEATGITKAQKPILENKELLEKLNLGEFYGKESVNETAVCNLASIALPKFVNKNKTYNHKKLYETAYTATVNLNNVIDYNYYPSENAKFSNILHRPIGLGVQGLADVFFLIGIPYDCDDAKALNKEIFETIYYGALSASNDLAKEQGTYETYKGSPLSEGKFQFDLWGATPTKRWDWEKLRVKILEHGVRNSLTTCVMPTASTAQILGNEASYEAQTSNMYSRGTLSGTFIMVNKYLVKELVKQGIWDDNIRKKIITENGSVQNIPEIPTNLKEIFKTVYEVKQKDVIDMCADRGAFVDQTQSMNIFMDSPNFAKLTAMHFYGWGRRKFLKDERGQDVIPSGDNIEIIYNEDGTPRFYRDKKSCLKTGIYYLRNKGAADAVKFTTKQATEEVKVDESEMSPKEFQTMVENSRNAQDDDDCLMCGS